MSPTDNCTSEHITHNDKRSSDAMSTEVRVSIKKSGRCVGHSYAAVSGGQAIIHYRVLANIGPTPPPPHSSLLLCNSIPSYTLTQLDSSPTTIPPFPRALGALSSLTFSSLQSNLNDLVL